MRDRPNRPGLPERVHRRWRALISRSEGSRPPRAAGPVFDASLDVRWAHADPRFDRLLHVFHAEWPGIRAAAGYTPGRKLAIPSGRPLEPAEGQAVLAYVQLERIETVVFHGCSANVFPLIDFLRSTASPGLRICAVWHGSTAQFTNPHELAWFGELLALRKRGVLNAFGGVKPGLHLLDPAIFPEPLLNLPPRLETQSGAVAAGIRRVFIPAPGNWHKNFYTALLASGGSRQVDEVVITHAFELPSSISLRAPVRTVDHLEREAVFELMRTSSLVLNPSLSECQPMVAVESLAVGVPCLTGLLSLGRLDQHPYQRLVQVPDVGSLLPVRAAVEAVLELQAAHPLTLRETMEDYQATLRTAALATLADFVSQ